MSDEGVTVLTSDYEVRPKVLKRLSGIVGVVALALLMLLWSVALPILGIVYLVEWFN